MELIVPTKGGFIMKHSSLHKLIIVTAILTGIIHLVVLSLLIGQVSTLFVLNGLGFLVLLAAWYYTPGFLSSQRAALHAVFILYTLATIGAWIAIGDKGDILGIITKLDEVVLLVALFLHLRSPEEGPASASSEMSS
jgi:hypothetical protein